MHNIARAIVFVSALCLTLAACGSTATPSVVAPSAVTPSVAPVSAASAVTPSVAPVSAAPAVAPSVTSSIAPSAPASGAASTLGAAFTFDPATLSCSNFVGNGSTAAAQTETVTLPSSVAGTLQFIFTADGHPGGGGLVSQMFKPQPDGSWVSTGTTYTRQELQMQCATVSIALGTHTAQVLDYATKEVIVEGSYTVTK
jgi:hypothetical protein